jgi:hypothetical protein
MARYPKLDNLAVREDLGQFVWGVADEYIYEEGWIKPVTSGESTLTYPLSDPGLFASFARLGAKGEPSESKVLAWIKEHGVLDTRKQRERRAYEDADNRCPGRDEYFQRFTKSVYRHSGIPITEFRQEVLLANSAAHLHHIFFTGGPPALKERAIWLRERQDSPKHHPVSELERPLVDNWDEEDFDIPKRAWHMNHPMFWMYVALQNLVSERVSDVRLTFFDAETPFFGPRDKLKPVQSWSCPDLRSAIWLQWYLAMTGASRIKVCENPVCRTPFAAGRRDNKFCTSTCRSTARNHR